MKVKALEAVYIGMQKEEHVFKDKTMPKHHVTLQAQA